MPFVTPQAAQSQPYSFIVVGGGTAGAVVAARLAENPSFRVLLVEAGEKDEGTPETIVPLLAPQASIQKPYLWPFVTEPVPGFNNRTLSYPRGKLLSGTSGINFSFYMRSSREDWDRTAKVANDPRWTWEAILPFAKKMETWVPPTDKHDITDEYEPSAHGDSGPILVSVPNSPSEMHKRIIQAGKQLPQYGYVKDLNAGEPLGVGWLPGTNGGGVRSGSARYLEKEMSNLDIVLGVTATRLLLDTTGEVPAVVGVEVAPSNGEGDRIQFKAEHEVILSAGSLASPQLLMLSGIGDRSELEPLGITVVNDLKDVGKNLGDHFMQANRFYVDGPSWDAMQRDPAIAAAAEEQYQKSFTGPLSNTIAQSAVFLRLPETHPLWTKKGHKDPSPGPASPQYEFLFGDGFMGFVDQLPEEEKGKNFVSAVTISLTPDSTGSVTLRSANYADHPVIQPNCCATEVDLTVAIEAIKDVRRFMKAPAFQGVVLGEYGPFKDAHTDEEIEAYIRNNSVASWHPTGTASISAFNSKTGVVNPDLTVKGVKNLRVIDASIFPYPPAAHPQIPVFIAGEVGAAIILDEYAKAGSV